MASVLIDIGCAACSYPTARLHIGDEGEAHLQPGQAVGMRAECARCENTVDFGKVEVQP